MREFSSLYLPKSAFMILHPDSVGRLPIAGDTAYTEDLNAYYRFNGEKWCWVRDVTDKSTILAEHLNPHP